MDDTPEFVRNVQIAWWTGHAIAFVVATGLAWAAILIARTVRGRSIVRFSARAFIAFFALLGYAAFVDWLVPFSLSRVAIIESTDFGWLAKAGMPVVALSVAIGIEATRARVMAAR